MMDKATIELAARIMQAAMLQGKRPYIRDVVKLLGVQVSTHHFKHCFSDMMGCGPAEYMRRWRTLIFIKVLRETKLTIPEMGLDYGFVDAGQTARIVKRETGYTCNQIRGLSRPELDALISKVRGQLVFPVEMPEELPQTKPQFRSSYAYLYEQE